MDQYVARFALVSLLWLAAIPTGFVHAAESADPATTAPEAVVRRYVQAWNDGDVDAFLAQTTADAVTYRHPVADDQLVGAADKSWPAPEQRLAHYRERFASTPHVHVAIVDTLQVGELVVSRERITGLPDGKTADELTVYRVRNGLIDSVWHVRRVMR